jgi:hypothetical protein
LLGEHQRQRAGTGEEVRLALEQRTTGLPKFARECHHRATVALDSPTTQCDFFIRFMNGIHEVPKARCSTERNERINQVVDIRSGRIHISGGARRFGNAESLQ